MHIAFENADFADYLLNSTKPARNKFFKRITEFKNFKRIVHQLGLTPVVTLVPVSQEEINVYKSSHNKKNTESKMSNQIKPHKSNSLKEVSKKHIDLFKDNKALKIHPNKLIHRSHSNRNTKENIVKEYNDIKKSNNDKDKHIVKNKEKDCQDRKEKKLSPTSASKTKDKCENKPKNSNDRTHKTENKISRTKIKETQQTSKDDKKHSNIKKLNTDTLNEVNVSKLDTKCVTHSKTNSNTNKSKTDQVYKPKKITERRKSYHDDKIPHENKEEESIFKRSNSQNSSKLTYLESDKKLNILQTNKQLNVNSSQLRKRSTSQSDKENLTKYTPEKVMKLSQNSTKIVDTNKETNNENEFSRKTNTAESRKHSSFEFSLFDFEVDLNIESKRSKTTDENSPGYTAFSTLEDTEVVIIDKTKILPPIDEFNSPYISFGDFLKNQKIPIIEKSPPAPEFSCTQLAGDKLLIKKRNAEDKTIVIDITDEGDELNNNVMSKEDFTTNVVESLGSDVDSTELINKENNHNGIENTSIITSQTNCDVKMKNCASNISDDGSLNNSQKSSSDNKESPIILFSKDCDVQIKSSNETTAVTNVDNSHDSSPDSSNKEKKHRVTEKFSVSSKKDCDNQMKKSNGRNVDTVKSHEISNKEKKQKTPEKSSMISSKNLESSSDSTNKGKKHKATENTSITSRKDCDTKINSSNTKTSFADRLENSSESSSFSINTRKEQKATENSSKISPKKDSNVQIANVSDKTSSLQRLNKSDENTLESPRKRKTQNVVEGSSNISPKNIESFNNRKRVVESLNSSHENSAGSTKKRKVQKATESSEKVVNGLDVNNVTINEGKKERNKDEPILLTKGYKNETKENLKVNYSTSDRNVFQKLQILITEQAVEFITSDLVSVLNVFVDFKQYTQKFKDNENKKVNNKDYFEKSRLKFLKTLRKKLENVKVYSFKTALFFDSLIESIKIHIAPKEILNEKTISRFLHNVLYLFMDNCLPPNDDYLLYNLVVSVKSLHYLDQKTFSLCGSIDKNIFDCMNSFSVKLERSKNSSNVQHKPNALPLIFCIDNSPDKITDVTPGNSLPCINTGENLVAKINPIKSSEIDVIPQISIVDSNNKKDNSEENLLDLLQTLPIFANSKCNEVQSSLVEKNTNNQSSTTTEKAKEANIELIESKLKAIFDEKFPTLPNNDVNMEKSQNTNCRTNVLCSDGIINNPVSVSQISNADSPNSEYSDSVNFLKNINPNKSYLVPVHSEKVLETNTSSPVSLEALLDNITNSVPATTASTPAAKTNASSSVSVEALFNHVTNSIPVTSTSTPTAKTNTSNKNIKIIDDIVVAPPSKHIFNPQSKLISLKNVNTQETNEYTKLYETEINSEKSKSNVFDVKITTIQNITSPNQLLKTTGTDKEKVTKRPYVRRKPLNKKNKAEDITILPKPLPVAGMENNFIPAVVAKKMKKKLNKNIAEVSPSSSSSCTTNQILQQSNSIPSSSAAPMQLQPTSALNILQQFCNPNQIQQSAFAMLSSIQQSQSQPNVVPMTWKLNTSSQFQQPSPAETITRSYLPPSSLSVKGHCPRNIYSQSSSAMPKLSEIPQPPPPPIISHQPYLPNKSSSQPVYQSSYTSSLSAAPLNLQSSNPREQHTQHVTLKQVVERTLVQEIQTQTVSTQQPSNYVSAYEQNMYQKHLQEIERQAFRQQQAEQERQKEQQHQEMLRLRRKLEMERQQQQTHEMQKKQELLRKQQQQETFRLQQEMMNSMNTNYHYNNNSNNNSIAAMYNSNNYSSVPSRQSAQYKLYEYAYPTYHSGYPSVSDNTMPQLKKNCMNGNARIPNYSNCQQSMQNEIRSNTVPIATKTAQRNNLVYPHITYPHLNLYGAGNNNSQQNNTTNSYFMQAAINQNARNVNNAPMQTNAVSSAQHTSVIVTNNIANTTRTSSHQDGNRQLLRAAGTTVVNTTPQNHTRLWNQSKPQEKTTNNSVEQHINELEELLNNDNAETTGAKEMDVAVRNSSRDSGYMTPTRLNPTCAYCLGVGSFFCSGCVNVYYCSAECQNNAWPSHQSVCYY